MRKMRSSISAASKPLFPETTTTVRYFLSYQVIDVMILFTTCMTRVIRNLFIRRGFSTVLLSIYLSQTFESRLDLYAARNEKKAVTIW